MSKIYKQWQHSIVKGKPFRMSAKMNSGKYAYVTFIKPVQFKNWLTNNQSKLHSVLGVTTI